MKRRSLPLHRRRPRRAWATRSAHGLPLQPREQRAIAEAAMRKMREGALKRLWLTPASVLRAGCTALLVCLGSCGGGASGPATDPTPNPAPSATEPLAPPPLAVGTALSIDEGAIGNPVSVRVVLAASGDGFAAWRSEENSGSKLWVNHYDASTATW